MSRILKVDQSDYRLRVQSGGSITLDTGTDTGTVVITGNLEVKGVTTSIETTNTTVTDNILAINYGQTGSGISSVLDYQAGINIGRGDLSDAQILFDEQLTRYNPLSNSVESGSFVLKFSDEKLASVQLGSVVLGSSLDLVFDMNSNTDNLIRIANMSPLAYSLLLSNPDHNTERYKNALTTKKYVNDYVAANDGMAVVDRIFTDEEDINGNIQIRSIVRTYVGSIVCTIDGVDKVTVTASGLNVNNITLYNNTISNTSNNPLVLQTTPAANLVNVNSVLGLQTQITSPTGESGRTKIYPLAMSSGRSGVFFVNDTLQDELVAKNRALLWSMLF